MSLRKRGLGLTLLVLISAVASTMSNVSAAQITSRSLTLQAGASDGGSKPGGVVKHLFSFTLPTNVSVGSIQFQYCTTASGTCALPTGLVTTAATLSSQSGATGFTMVNTTNGAPYLTRTAAVLGSANLAVTYQLSTITNPSATNSTFFVRISDYAATNATGGTIDTGTVAASTATQIVLTGTMPESLIFCTGQAITVTNSVPDCTTATAGLINFNQLFSPTDTAIATSQFAASTNALTGYSVTINGPTMTSGGNTITGMSTADISRKGVSQFGMNLKLNTTGSASSFATAGTSAEITPVSDGVNLKGQAAAGYNTVDTFKFLTGDPIANSAYPSSAGPTNAQLYTAAYIVNVPGNQLAGTYTTTLTYICTPTF